MLMKANCLTAMKPLNQLLIVLFMCNVHFAAEAAFSFTVNVISHSTGGNCFGDDISLSCETYFSTFCLRGPRGTRSTSTSDCPLGTGGELKGASGSRVINSNAPWQGGFQLLMPAYDDDAGISYPDFLDNIFVDRTQSANSALSSQNTYSGNRVSAVMTFSVECQQGYYRSDCTVFCQASDSDQNGHFSCNPIDGSHVCLADYYGPECITFCQASNTKRDGFYTCDSNDGSRLCNAGYANPDNYCREDIDDCASEPCLNGGNCTDLVADFICSCPAGLTGKNCSHDINECLTADCSENSTCTDGLDAFTCTCNLGFEGENCTEITPCDPSPCENGGTCTNDDPFNFTCTCPEGYTGVACEVDIDECRTVICSGDTTCIDVVNGYQCMPLSSKPQSKKNLTIIMSVGGIMIMIITFIILVTVIVILTKKRMKTYTGTRSVSHIYHSPPTQVGEKFEMNAGSKRPFEDTMETNPNYGNNKFVACTTNMTTVLVDANGSLTQRTVDNPLYTTQNGTDSGNGTGDDNVPIYSTVKNAAGRDKVIVLCSNVAYGSHRDGPDRNLGEVNNPLYVSEPARNTSSHYSTSRPSENGEDIRIKVLHDQEAGTITPHSNKKAIYYESIELVDEKKPVISPPPPPPPTTLPSRNQPSCDTKTLPHHGAVYNTPTKTPTASTSIVPSADDFTYAYVTSFPLITVENHRYSKLDHGPPKQQLHEKQPQLSAIKDSGYESLQPES